MAPKKGRKQKAKKQQDCIPEGVSIQSPSPPELTPVHDDLQRLMWQPFVRWPELAQWQQSARHVPALRDFLRDMQKDTGWAPGVPVEIKDAIATGLFMQCNHWHHHIAGLQHHMDEYLRVAAPANAKLISEVLTRCCDLTDQINELHEFERKLDAQINKLRVSESKLWAEFHSFAELSAEGSRTVPAVDALHERGRSATQSASTAEPRAASTAEPPAASRRPTSDGTPEYNRMQEQLHRAEREEKQQLQTAHQGLLQQLAKQRDDDIKSLEVEHKKKLKALTLRYDRQVEIARMQHQKELELLRDRIVAAGVAKAQRLAARSRSPNPNYVNRELRTIVEGPPVDRTPSPRRDHEDA